MPSFLKRHKLLLLLLIIVYVSYFFLYYKSPANISPQEVRGIRTNLTLFEEPDAGREPILNAINGAKKAVHVEVYFLSDKQIIDALIRKKSEGVDVKIMLEEHPYGGGNVNKKSKKILEDGGVQIAWTNPYYALTHEKAIIIDGIEVFILNQNLTTSSFEKNREFDIVDDNLQDAMEVEKMFVADWERRSFTPARSNLVISPYTSRAKLTSILLSAASEIDVEMEVINDKEIIALLKKKAKSTKVMVILPSFSNLQANEAVARKLEDSGVDVKILSAPYIHAKLLVTDDNKAYVGSINFTTQSMDENRELGIVISEADVIQKLTESFDADWEKAVDYK